MDESEADNGAGMHRNAFDPGRWTAQPRARQELRLERLPLTRTGETSLLGGRIRPSDEFAGLFQMLLKILNCPSEFCHVD